LETLSSRFQVLGIDLQGVFHMSKACLPHLKKSGQATGDSIIINITATLMNTATPFQMHAASAKAGINVLTQVCSPLSAQPVQRFPPLYPPLCVRYRRTSCLRVRAQSMGLEWAEYGIRVVGIAPGPIADTVGGPGGRVFGQGLTPCPQYVSQHAWFPQALGSRSVLAAM
jgi:peroxisomal 2,4-dienoyl-CoA reductase